MKIAFITGSLEPGKDGVGDYTRLLAEECVRQGHKCCLVSLSDRFLKQSQQLKLDVGGLKFPILRLPANASWTNRIAHAKDFLDLFQPDWVSLQFVPYGFHSKGIIYQLSKCFKQIAEGRKFHIMFHELWIGESQGAKLKERVIGKIQRFFILRLVNQIQPLVVHTSNSTYVAILKQNNVLASRLPLFGNIPLVKQNGDAWLFPQLQKEGLDIKAENRNQFWLFGFFGKLLSNWPSEPLFTYINQAATQCNYKVAIISIGRLGSGEALWENLYKNYSHQFTFLRLGEQSQTKVSEFFNSIDFGIAISPYLLVGKSGNVAAMLEHGVPVIVNRDDFQLSSCFMPLHDDSLLLYRMDCYLVDKLKKGKLSRTVAQPCLSTTTTQFIKDLSRSTLVVKCSKTTTKDCI